MTLTGPRLLTALAILVVVLMFTFLTRCNGEHADEAPAEDQTGATPVPVQNPPNAWRADSTRPDPTAAVVGGAPAGVASDAAAAVAAAAEATAADSANR